MSDDEEEVAAALEARLQTLEHLNSQEAATMLSRMAPQQASQMMLLMGSSKRSEVLEVMTEAQKESIAAALPADTAIALGMQSVEKAADGDADVTTFKPPPRGPLMEDQQGSVERDTTMEASESAVGLESETPEQASSQPQVAREAPGEVCTVQETGSGASSSSTSEDEDAGATAMIEIPSHTSLGAVESQPSQVQDESASSTKVCGSESQVVEEGGCTAPAAAAAATEEIPTEAVEVVEDVQDGIVDTWLVNDKPAVREHISVRGYMSRPAAQMHPDTSSRDAAQVAFHLSPLPDHTIAKYLEELPPQECEAVLANFPPERRRSILDHLCEEEVSSSSSTQVKPPRVSQLSERALGFAGNMAARAKQGISEMAPEASTKTAAASHVAATEMKRAAARASHAAGWARHSMSQAADKAAATKSAEYAKTAANSALSAARVGVSSAAHQASTAAETARHGVEKFVSSSSSSPAVESSSRMARQMTQDAKQKVSGAAEAAKGGLASMSKGMATLFKSAR
mmetsp:Transcript_35219/g.76087  ORF Transcript_35219/g.76087 Transcript_35219/m.76087 type:complete len:516 (-) Transcript_35219:10-1557(-)